MFLNLTFDLIRMDELYAKVKETIILDNRHNLE